MSSIIHITTLLIITFSWLFSCQAEKLDCTRMVFHPRCRGISAKRSSSVPLFEEDTDKQYSSDDSFESSNWKNEIDNDLVERIIRDILLTSMKRKNHGHTYIDDEK